MNTPSVIQKVWNFCHTLKDDGPGYGDYLEQLTYLLFLKMAHEFAQEPYLRDETFHGNEIVAATRRLCLMNLFLHNIGELEGEPSVERADALIAEPKRRVNYVLANPPFGKKSSMTFTNEDGEEDRDALIYERQDFWTTTSNKQLNFLQHIVSMLKVDGRAAVVLPDNVLFEGGAGEKIRQLKLDDLPQEIIEHLEAALAAFRDVAAALPKFDEPRTK